jgi:hypothetical protein
MKTVYKNETYYRLSDKEADRQVNAGIATYAPKSAWKNKVRDASKLIKSQPDQLNIDEVKQTKKTKNVKNKRN